MGAKAGIALKFLQWFLRAIQFCCSAVVLALFSYFLATLHNHDLPISVDARAVEGISGVGVLYTAAGLLFLCCLAGHPITSFIAMVIDLAFAGAFIYVAVQNRGGAGSCTGTVNTFFGTGNANDRPTGADGFTNLPTYKEACQMETASMAVSIIAVFFFLFSIFVEIALVRQRKKEQRIGPSPANNYTSGYGRGGFFSRFRRRGTNKTTGTNNLPEHTTPEQLRTSYATETTAVGHEPVTYNKYGEHGHDGQTAYPDGQVSGANGYRYDAP